MCEVLDMRAPSSTVFTRRDSVTLAPCGLWGCKNMACCFSFPEVVKGIPNQSVACFVSWGSFFSVSDLCLGCMWCFVSLFLVVSTSAVDCL